MTFSNSPWRPKAAGGHLCRDQPGNLVILENRTVPEKTVKVRAKAPFRVVYQGNPQSDGDTFTVPEKVAQEWERSRWVERVTGKT